MKNQKKKIVQKLYVIVVGVRAGSLLQISLRKVAIGKICCSKCKAKIALDRRGELSVLYKGKRYTIEDPSDDMKGCCFNSLKSFIIETVAKK